MTVKPLQRAESEASSALSEPPSDIGHCTTSVAVQTADTTTALEQPRGAKRKRQSVAVKAESELVESPKNKRQSKRRPAVALPQEKSSTTDRAETEIALKPTRTRKQAIVDVKEEVVEEEAHHTPAIPKNRPKPKAKVDAETTNLTKVVRKRKTKEEKDAEAMPLAARTIGHKMLIGAHVSAAGGVHNAALNAVHIGANAFALFLKSQRKWANPPLDPAHCTSFHHHCAKLDYSQNQHVVPHGSYLVNLAHTDKDRTTQAYDSFVDDLHRCEKLGITLYNFHPGNALNVDRADAIAHLASNMNRAHKETSTVVTLLENMAAGGNVLGSTFEDLRDIISHIDDKSRVGVCLDTCHAFAAGYDLRTNDALQDTLANFDRLVGIKYLRALHLNDSKAPFHSNRDLHANIGTGFLGLRAFHAIVNEPRFQGLPMVLETPIQVRDDDGNLVKDEKAKEVEDKGIWAREIKMLESLVAMDPESDQFKQMEKQLQRKGAPERARVLDQVERRDEKKSKAAVKAKAGAKGKKGKKLIEQDSQQSDTSDLSDVD